MDRQHGAQLSIPDPGQGLRQGLPGHQAAVGIHIGEHHLGAHIAGAVGRRQEGDRGGDHHLARPDVEGQHGQVQGRRAVGAGHRVARAHRLGEGGLEGGHRGPGGEEIPTQGLGHRGDVVLLDGLAAVGEQGLAHGFA